MQDAAHTPLRSGRRGWRAWFAPWGKGLGSWAFALNRLTGLGLVFYLALHLWVLRLLARGPQAWDAFIALAKQPFFLFLDGLLFFGVLYHGLNGLRVTLVGLGIGVRAHRRLFWVLMALGVGLLLLSLGGLLATTG